MKFYVDLIEMISVQEIKPKEEMYWITRFFRWLRGEDKPPAKYKADYKIYLADLNILSAKELPVWHGDLVMVQGSDILLHIELLSGNPPKFIASTVHARLREDLDALTSCKGECVIVSHSMPK